MGGVGNFNRDNRTLYIGGLKHTQSANLEVEYFFEFFPNFFKINFKYY